MRSGTKSRNRPGISHEPGRWATDTSAFARVSFRNTAALNGRLQSRVARVSGLPATGGEHTVAVGQPPLPRRRIMQPAHSGPFVTDGAAFASAVAAGSAGDRPHRSRAVHGDAPPVDRPVRSLGPATWAEPTRRLCRPPAPGRPPSLSRALREPAPIPRDRHRSNRSHRPILRANRRPHANSDSLHRG